MSKNVYQVPDVCTSVYNKHSVNIPYIIGIISTFMISFNTHSNSIVFKELFEFKELLYLVIMRCNQDYEMAAIF